MAARGLFAVAASLLVGLATSGCAESDASLSAAEYEELTHVVRARLSPCLSNQAFVPNWPTSRWQPPPSRSRAPAVQINDTALVSDGTRYYVHFADEGRAILHLQPIGETPGGKWWRQRTRELALDVGFDLVAHGLACIQFAPYHSSEYHAGSPRLPSQEYSFFLVRQAMARGAEVVVMRSVSLWLSAVPELASYKRLHRGSNPRAPFLSRGNLKSAYNIISERLRSAA